MVKHWHKLPTQMADAPSLETLKIRLDRVMGNLLRWKMSMLISEALD